MNKKELANAVINFFHLENISFEDAINTSINDDLQISGDDVDFILSEFREKFKVDLSDLKVDDYFLPELLWEYWYYKWFKPEKLKKKPLTVGHMVEVVERGY